MLASRHRLCRACRSDLSSLFTRGFCGPAVPRSTPAVRVAASDPRWRPRRRLLHSGNHLYQDSRTSKTDTNSNSDPPERYLSDHELRAQFEAFNAFEEFAVERSAKEEPARRQTAGDEGERGKAVNPYVSEYAPSPLAHDNENSLQELYELRKANADDEAVAEKARALFGDRIPLEALQGKELDVYTRLYGEPLLPEAIDNEDEVTLLDEAGETVAYDAIQHDSGLSIENNDSLESQNHTVYEGMADELSTDKEKMHESEMHPDEMSAEEASDDFKMASTERQHPLTALGKFETSPRTVAMPLAHYVRPFDNIMRAFDNGQLKKVCERAFGGPGLPDSPLTPRSGKMRPQVAVQLEAGQHYMGEQQANAFVTSVMPPAYAAVSAALVDARKRLGPTWLNNLLAKDGGPRILDAGAGGAAILAWNQIVQAHWESLHTSEPRPNPPPASKPVVLVGSDPLRHRAASLLDNTTFIPRLPDYVTTRSKPTMDDQRPVQQRKSFDVIFSTYSLLPFREEWERKQYIQNLWSLLSPEGGLLILIEKGIPRGFESIAAARKLLLERFIATPPGQDNAYTAVHKQNEADGAPYAPEPGMIVGPCSNHEACPMYKIEGVSIGRKDICSFQQRYIRPPHLQRVLGASARNHDDADFSYLSVMKGRDLRRSEFNEWSEILDPLTASTQVGEPSRATPQSNSQAFLDHVAAGFDHVQPVSSGSPASDHAAEDNAEQTESDISPTHLLPRLVFAPIKRRGHVILDLCTPKGTIERWTVPRSFSKQAYRDARKAQHGDLWALGAKTRIPRNLRQGSGKDKISAILDGHMKGKGREEKLANASMKIKERLAQERAEEREERKLEEQLAALDDEPYSATRSRRSDNNDEAEADSRPTKPSPAGRNIRSAPSPKPADADLDDRPLESASTSDAEADAEADLEHEIEMKLRAWEADLADKRPLDRHGRPERVSRMRQRKMAEARSAQDKDDFWDGVAGESADAQPQPVMKKRPTGGRLKGGLSSRTGRVRRAVR